MAGLSLASGPLRNSGIEWLWATDCPQKMLVISNKQQTPDHAAVECPKPNNCGVSRVAVSCFNVRFCLWLGFETEANMDKVCNTYYLGWAKREFQEMLFSLWTLIMRMNKLLFLFIYF